MAENDFDKMLKLLPGNSTTGINIEGVEKERKMYWDKFYMKYSALSESESECLAIDQIDDISMVKDRPGLKLVDGPISRTARKFLKDNIDVVDELTTIAGPPGSDEEEISEDDSEDEDMELEVSDCVNHIQTPVKTDSEEVIKIPEKPASINNSDGEIVSEIEVTDDENQVGDSDEDLGLCSPIARPKSSIQALSINIARKSINKQIYVKPCLDNKENESDTKCSGCENSLDESSVLLNASILAQCDTKRCDDCLLNKTHADCEDDDCQVCMDVVATVKARNLLRQRATDDRRK